jgi:hypothetical protein
MLLKQLFDDVPYERGDLAFEETEKPMTVL